MTYFSSFPQGVYANTKVVDLTRRAALRRSLISDRRVYLPYEMRDGERADQVAQHYYDDPQNAWMVYMSAGIIDPYHEMPLSQRDFNEHVVAKYGSVELATERTKHWQLDWATDDREISISGFNALEPQLKKYWMANLGHYNQVLSYSLRDEDWVLSTNMVVRLDIEPTSNVGFAAGDLLTVYTGPVRDGTAEVAWANSSVLKIVHVAANVVAGQVIKTDGGANATVTDLQYVSNTIPVDERPYWTRVSMYDWERDRNESRKHIRLVDKKYTNQMKNDLKKVLAANTR